MNRGRVREMIDDVREHLQEVEQLLANIGAELEVPDDPPPPASTRKGGRGSRLVLEDKPPPNEMARAMGRKAVRGIIGGPSLVGSKKR